MSREQASGVRHVRLQESILGELRDLLRDDVGDPSLGQAEIHACVLSGDVRSAKVHFSLRGADDAARDRADRAFLRATPFLRSRLAEALDLKRVPELRFVFVAALPED